MKPNSKIICDKDGTIKYYLNNKYHREDGPAIECIDGFKQWLQNGKLHREDGHAREWPDGFKAWYIRGKSYSEQEFLKKTSKSYSCDGKVVEIDGKKYKLTEV